MEQRKIKCPHCGLLTFYSTDNPSRPFCSARCKLLDLGQWADESFKIPAEKLDLNSDEFNPEPRQADDDENS